MNTFFSDAKQNPRLALASREGRTTTVCQCLALLVLLAIGQGPLHAARTAADPLLVQLEDGYGVITAVIEKSSKVPSSMLYEIRFRVEEILAQPVIGERVPAKKGTTIVLRLAIGYGGTIEDAFIGPGMVGPALSPGTKYILKVKYDKRAGKYEHASGASCAERVTTVSPETTKLYRIIHEIASQPEDRRVKRCRELVVKAKADSVVDARLRTEALQWLTRRVKDIDDRGPTAPGMVTKAERDETLAVLLRVWKDSSGRYTIEELSELDYSLRSIRSSFVNSADRRQVWLTRLFAPIPGEGSRDDIRKRVNERMEDGHSVLSELAQKQPSVVGSYLVKELKTNNRPMLFRIYIATVLHGLYENQVFANPLWEPALQTFYEKAIATADADDLYPLLSNLSPKTRNHRREEWRLFKPKFPLEEHLQKALERMRGEEKKATSGREVKVIQWTIFGIEELLQKLKKAREAK